jgi:hypothetical protein
MQTTTSAGSSTARRNVLVLAGAAVMAAGCSGPTEDVRVTLCKNLTTTLQSAQSIEWKGNENSFRRPEYAITALTYEAVDRDGRRSGGQSACHYAYEALEDTAVTLADPLSAYANLPFAMTFNGRTLSDAELLQLVNAEQRRQGRQAVETLKKGARDVADKVREKISQ